MSKLIIENLNLHYGDFHALKNINMGIEEGKIKLPCKAILSGFGAGLTWGTVIVRLREGIA